MSQQINLFNPVFLAQKKYFSALAMSQALGSVLVALILLQVFAARQTGGLQDLLEGSAREATQRREQLVTVSRQFSDKGTSKQLEEEIARVEAQLRTRGDLFEQIKTSVGGDVGGFTEYLRALARRTTPGVWLTGIEISGKTRELVVTGRALSSELVPAYVRSLSGEPVFAGRSLSALQISAREEPAPEPGSPAGSPAAPRPPSRYLEFTLNIPLGAPAGERGPEPKGAS
jgi:Tfp pilus assembly protein PilN